MVVSDGVNIYPAEIEAVIGAIPGVRGAISTWFRAPVCGIVG
ncbi:hypothetical protein [Nocardia sp. NPDC005998]